MLSFEAEGMALWWVSVKMAQRRLRTWPELCPGPHSSGAICPMLSQPPLTEAPESTKNLLRWPLITLASSHLLGRGGRTSEVPNYAEATAQDAPADDRWFYAQSTSDSPLFKRKSETKVSGLGRRRHLWWGASDISLAFPKEDIYMEVHQRLSIPWNFLATLKRSYSIQESTCRYAEQMTSWLAWINDLPWQMQMSQAGCHNKTLRNTTQQHAREFTGV